MGYCLDCIVRNENFVLQGKVCIATKRGLRDEVYCNTSIVL